MDKTAKDSVVPPRYIDAFEMPDDSMDPRIRKGEYAILGGSENIEFEAGDEVLVQLIDGRWLVRTLARCSDTMITLSTYNPPSEATLDRRSIAAIHRVDMIVPPTTFALMVEQRADNAEVFHG